ncbi:hypothetical protein UCD39_01420 [Nitrospirillum sp. BR 11752]|uniref:hypothetical protein n=1 Tax=Nitrospirillum sp. BR 11752 TaxID=3104293 RepID=UPI002EA6E948|nr:hypothetical protein [Nitrospirillum sp. BR 11752]
MTAGPPDDFLKKIWKDQPQEMKPMSVTDIRSLASTYRRKLRTRIIVGAGLGMALAGLFGWQAWNETDPIIRIGEVFSVLGAIMIVWFASDTWPGDLPSPSATCQAVTDYYRHMIARRRIAMPSAVAVALPSLMGVATIAWGYWVKSGDHHLGLYLPLIGLIMLWSAAYVALHRRRSRALKRKLDELGGPPGP